MKTSFKYLRVVIVSKDNVKRAVLHFVCSVIKIVFKFIGPTATFLRRYSTASFPRENCNCIVPSMSNEHDDNDRTQHDIQNIYYVRASEKFM